MTESVSIDPSIDPARSPNSPPWRRNGGTLRGKFAPLHKFNPVRLAFIRAEAAAHFGRDARGLKPFEGLKLLDMGCGGGLLCEPMARLGFGVTGADASEKNIGTARAHAAQAGLLAGRQGIDYCVSTAEALAEGRRRFDVVLNMEVFEHVADVSGYLKACARLLKPGGLTVVATLNKTLQIPSPWQRSGRSMC